MVRILLNISAAAQGHVHVLQWLVESGVDLSLRNSQGKTAADVARRYGNKQCVKVLGGNPGITEILNSTIVNVFKMKGNNIT